VNIIVTIVNTVASTCYMPLFNPSKEIKTTTAGTNFSMHWHGSQSQTGLTTAVFISHTVQCRLCSKWFSCVYITA